MSLLSDWVFEAAPGPQHVLGCFILAPRAILQVAILQVVLQRLPIDRLMLMDLVKLCSILTKKSGWVLLILGTCNPSHIHTTLAPYTLPPRSILYPQPFLENLILTSSFQFSLHGPHPLMHLATAQSLQSCQNQKGGHHWSHKLLMMMSLWSPSMTPPTQLLRSCHQMSQ